MDGKHVTGDQTVDELGGGGDVAETLDEIDRAVAQQFHVRNLQLPPPVERKRTKRWDRDDRLRSASASRKKRRRGPRVGEIKSRFELGSAHWTNALAIDAPVAALEPMRAETDSDDEDTKRETTIPERELIRACKILLPVIYDTLNIPFDEAAAGTVADDSFNGSRVPEDTPELDAQDVFNEAVWLKSAQLITNACYAQLIKVAAVMERSHNKTSLVHMVGDAQMVQSLATGVSAITSMNNEISGERWTREGHASRLQRLLTQLLGAMEGSNRYRVPKRLHLNPF